MGNPVVHFEITHKDADQLRTFYERVFDWKIDGSNPMNYAVIDTGEGIGGGIGQAPDESYPGHVTFYVQVADVEASLQQIEQLGGKRVMGPEEMEGGPTVALFNDPSGNMIGLVKEESTR
jgi:uncharacterized protein